jgi:transaldolase
MPEATLNAVADHGVIDGDRISGTYEQSQRVLDELAGLGIGYDEVVQLLEAEGVQKFEDAWKQVLDGVQGQLDAARG